MFLVLTIEFTEFFNNNYSIQHWYHIRLQKMDTVDQDKT